MQKKGTDLLAEVAQYYDDKLAEHGEGARGVDWNGEQGQIDRFMQLCKVIKPDADFSVNDLGCGYGALFEYLRAKRARVFYCGIDVSHAMIQAAQRRYGEEKNCRFLISSLPDAIADYGLASGIFNVRQQRTDVEWKAYIEETLNGLNQTSRLGFAFNCLTSYSDEHKKKEYLYYADPLAMFDYCKRNFSRNVALLHDYGLYEFTLLVRKEGHG